MLLKDMVEIYSPTGQEEELVNFLVGWAGDNGLRARKDEVGNLVAHLGPGEEGSGVLLVGHVDTVPGRIPVRVEDNVLYGRGSVDAKGPMASFLQAALASGRENVTVIGVVEEEGDSKGAKYIVDKYDPEFIVVGEPSGWSNINIGYKGRINVRYNLEKGKEHTSRSEANCYEEGIKFFQSLRDYAADYNQGKSLFGQLGLKLTGINGEDDGLTERIRMTLNFRTPLGFDMDGLRARVEALAGEAEVDYSDHEEAVKVSKANPLVSSFLRSIRGNGGEPSFKLKTGTSDMNVLAAYGVPMVTYGPGDSNLDHTPNEHLPLDEYEKAVQVLTGVLKDLK